MSATNTFQVPADDPGVVLFRLARKARLPYSSRFVSNAVALHPQPQSLLAVVQVGPHLGLRITAAKVEPDGLDDLKLPAIVHFAAGAGGFGVLERVAPQEVVVWDSRNGRRRVARAAFLESWSGIVALAERDDSQRKTEPGYRKQRFSEVLAGGLIRPDLAGPPAGRPLAAITVLLLALALAVAVAGRPGETRLAAAAVALLAAAGVAVGAILSNATAGMTANPNVPGCPRGKLVNCESVLNSPYSKVRGIPMSDLGTSFFGAVLLLAATAAVEPARPGPWAALAFAYLAAAPVALLLVGTQVAMRKFCTMCLVVHALVLAGAAASWTFVDGGWRFGDVVAAGALFAVYYALVLFLAIPFFTREKRTRELIGTHNRVSGSPFATLAHLATETPAPLGGAACGIRLAGPPAAHELVLFAHPNCKQCAHTIPEISALAAAGASEVYVTILPRYPDGPERGVCEAVLAAGRAGGAEAFLKAYFHAKSRFLALMDGDSSGELARETSLPHEALEAKLGEARAMIAHAESVAEGRIEGTPAMFFDTRLYPYNVPVAHLETLLGRHAALLPSRPGTEARQAAPA
ncbi:MAG: cysteine peptidase family C39 domain-containing protein [Actinomycetota bacterium]|nr:cysteine peptidase family C39 domain-containing protein [Actinomycetota bacterium]